MRNHDGSREADINSAHMHVERRPSLLKLILLPSSSAKEGSKKLVTRYHWQPAVLSDGSRSDERERRMRCRGHMLLHWPRSQGPLHSLRACRQQWEHGDGGGDNPAYRLSAAVTVAVAAAMIVPASLRESQSGPGVLPLDY